MAKSGQKTKSLTNFPQKKLHLPFCSQDSIIIPALNLVDLHPRGTMLPTSLATKHAMGPNSRDRLS
jgi:hypothetical protein